MISTGAFLNEMDASNKQPSTAEKFAAVWEKKNAKAARAGGVSLMALSLAACGSSSTDTTSTSDTSTDDTTTTVTPTAQTIALTVGSDAATGGAGDDTFTAARVDTVQTWSSSDTIAGGDGTDSLTATINADVTPGTGGVTGVENVTVTAIGGATVDFSSATANFITGVTSLKNLSSTGATNFEDITAVAEMSVENIASQTTLFQYNDSVLSGSDDSVTLNLSGVVGAVTVGTNGDADGDYETLVINANGADSDMVAGGGLGGDAATVTINGSAALDLGTTAAFANLATLNASGNSGGVTVTVAADGVSGSTNTKTITGSSGNDTIDFSAVTAASVGAVTVDGGAGNDDINMGGTGATDFTVTGGDGTDTLRISTTSAAATHGGVSGFETLRSDITIADNTTTTLNMSLFTANSTFETVNVEGTLASAAANAADVFSITNASDTIQTLGLGALDLSDADVRFARLVDGTASTLTIKSTADSAAKALAANDEETITFNAKFAMDYTAVSATDMTSLVGVGSHDLDLGTVTATKLASVDVSGLQSTAASNTTAASNDEGDFIADLSSSTKAMTVTANTSSSHAGIINITTGSGGDTVTGTANADTISTGNGTDTIDAGAGDDEITGGAGRDTITGGTGSDDFNMSLGADGATAATNLWDVITDFTAQTAAGAAVDMIDIDVETTGTEALREVSSQLTATSGVDNGDIIVYTGGSVIDVSGNNAADIAAINTALFDADAVKANNDAIVVFSADTDGDGDGDEVQVWGVGESGGTASSADFAYQLATLSNIDATSDLAGVFVVGNFDVT